MMNFVYNIIARFKSLSSTCENYNVISFDIFDTLIVRLCASPEKVFYIVEDLYNREYKNKISDFFHNRIVAEQTARLASNMEEVSLDDIYNCLTSFYDIEICNRLKTLETVVEIEQCSARLDILEIYNKCISNKKDVFIVSDMYLSLDVIKQILIKNDIKLPKKIYLSSDVNKTKRKGSLFRLLLQENNLKAKDVLHIGDNIKSDFLKPKLLGMNAYWIEKKDCNNEVIV